MSFVNKVKTAQILNHSDAYRDIANDRKVLRFNLNVDSTAMWARNFPLYMLEEYFTSLSPSSALTVGDGKGAHEAQILKRFGLRSCASDISTELIEKAFANNLIDDFKCIDAENTGLPDDAFDIALVKESLHHLSRPYLCVYELMRIARESIVIIEPNGDACYTLEHESYEKSGNYKYQFTTKELVQCSLSLGLTNVAIGWCPNPVYITNCHYMKTHMAERWRNAKTRPDSRELARVLLPELRKTGEEFLKIKSELNEAVVSWFRAQKDVSRNPLIIFVASKSEFTEDQIKAFNKWRFFIPNLKKNPYL